MGSAKGVDRLIVYLTIAYLLWGNLSFTYNGIAELCMLLSVLLAFYFNALRTRGKIRLAIGRYHLMTLAFIGFCYLSTLWAKDAMLTVQVCAPVSAALLLLYVLYPYYKTKNIDIMLFAVMMSMYLTCVVDLYNLGVDTYIYAIVTGTRVADENWMNANVLGAFAAKAMVISFYFVLYQKKIKWWLVFVVPALIAMGGAGSRRSILILFGGVFLLFFMHSLDKKKFLLSMLRVIAIILVIVIALYYISRLALFRGIFERMSGVTAFVTGRGKVDGSTRDRAHLMQIGIELFMSSPLLGVGINNPRILNPIRNGYLHSNLFEVLAGGGLVGICLYAALYLYPLYCIWKYRACRTPQSDICLVLILLQLGSDLTDMSYMDKDTYFFVMIYFIEAWQLRIAYQTKRKERLARRSVRTISSESEVQKLQAGNDL